MAAADGHAEMGFHDSRVPSAYDWSCTPILESLQEAGVTEEEQEGFPLAMNSDLALLKVLRSLDSTDDPNAMASSAAEEYYELLRKFKAEWLSRETPSLGTIPNSATAEEVGMTEPS